MRERLTQYVLVERTGIQREPKFTGTERPVKVKVKMKTQMSTLSAEAMVKSALAGKGAK